MKRKEVFVQPPNKPLQHFRNATSWVDAFGRTLIKIGPKTIIFPEGIAPSELTRLVVNSLPATELTQDGGFWSRQRIPHTDQKHPSFLSEIDQNLSTRRN